MPGQPASSLRMLGAAARVLCHRRVLPVLALSLFVMWLAGFPLIRLSYSALVLPLRSVQYYFSIDRPDAGRLAELTGIAGHGAAGRYLEGLGVWAVLRELRAEELSLEQQAIALAIVRQESDFRFYAKNPRSTACGLFQLIKASGERHDLKWWGCMDPVYNARAGTAFFQTINTARAGGFAETLRCSYLKVYYGPAHDCRSDATAIWSRAGKRVSAGGTLFLKALQQLKEEQAARNALQRAWRICRPWLIFSLLPLAAVLVRRPGNSAELSEL